MTTQTQEPLPPELFPGYRDMISAEHQRLSLSVQQGEVLRRKSQQLIQSATERPVVQPTKLPIVGGGIFDFGIEAGKWFRAQFNLPTGELNSLDLTTSTEAQDKELKQVGADLAAQAIITDSAQWRLGILNVLPAALQTSKIPINNVDDLIRTLGMSTHLTEEDRQFAQKLIDTLSPKAAQVLKANNNKPANNADTARILSDLQRPTGSFKKLYSINPDRMSIEEVVSTLNLANRFELPQGVASTDELRAMLRAQQIPEADIQHQLDDVTKEITDIVKELNLNSAKLAAIARDGQDIANGKISSMIDRARWQKAATQPLLVFMRPMEYWIKHIAQPAASIGIQAIAPWEPMLADRKGITLSDYYRKARDSGVGYWAANQLAWEEWDTNAALKFAAEVAFDPSSYVGFGVYTKVFSGLPYIGRFAGPAVGAVEEGYNALGELPFRGLRVAFNYIPKTLEQKALIHTSQLFDDLRVWLERDIYKKPFTQITPAEMQTAAAAAVSSAMDNPLAPDLGTRVGIWLLGRRTITGNEVADLITEMGVKNIDLTPTMLEKIQTVQEFTQGIGNTKFLTPNESAPLIAKAMGITDSEENLSVIGQFLTKTRDSMRRKALNNFEQDTTQAILNSVMFDYRDAFVKAGHDVISNDRYLNGITDRMLTRFDTARRQLFISGIDHFLTRPFARAYLLFAAFAPLNIVEMTAKGLVAGAGPLYKGLSAQGRQGLYRRASSTFIGIEGDVPIEWLMPERYVPQAQLPDDKLRILSATTLLSTKQRQEAERTTMNWLESALTGRWMRYFTGGRELQQLVGYDWGAMVGNAMSSDMGTQLYYRELAKREPQLVEQAGKLVDSATLGLEQFIDPKYAEAYRQELFERLLTGNKTHVRNIVNDFSPSIVQSAEVAKLVEQAPEIYHITAEHLIRKANTGELFAKGAQGIVDEMGVLKEALSQSYFESAKAFSTHFKTVIDDFAAWEPETALELNVKVAFIDHAAQMYGEMIHGQVVNLKTYADRYRNPIEKDAVYNNIWRDRIAPFIDSASVDIEQTLQGFRKQLGVQQIIKDMPLEQRQSYLAMLDNLLTSTAKVKASRQAQNALRREFFTPTGSRYVAPGKGRDNTFWDTFQYENNLIWEANQNDYLAARATNMRLSVGLPGYVAPTPVNASSRPLTIKDVASLWQSNPADLKRSMYLPELQALKGRKDFTKLVRDAADLGGGAINQTADSLGYTEEAVNKVYDQIMFSLKADPRLEQGLEPALIQLKNLQDELIRLGRNKDALVSPEFSNRLQVAVDELVGREATTRIIPAVPERVTPEIATVKVVTSEEILSKQEGALLETTIPQEIQAETEAFIQRVLTDEGYTKLTPLGQQREQQLRAIWAKPTATFDPNLKTIDWNDEPKWELKLADLADSTSTELRILAPEALRNKINNIRGVLRPASGHVDRTNLEPAIADLADIGQELKDSNLLSAVQHLRDAVRADNYTQIGLYADAVYNIITARLPGATSLQGSTLRALIEEWFEESSNEALQSFGRLANSNLAYKEGIQQLLKQRYPSGYIRVYRGGGAAKRTGLDPLEREYTNVTASRETAKKFESVNDTWEVEEKLYFGVTGKQPQVVSSQGKVGIDSVIIRAEDVVSIASAKESELIIPSAVLKERMANPITVPSTTERIVTRPERIIPGVPQRTRRVPAVPGIVDKATLPDGTANLTSKVLTSDYQNTRAAALQETRRQFFNILPDYTHQNMFNGLMRTIFPFWTYETHRLWYLPKTFMQKPGIWSGWNKYQDHTDQGYIHVPGTSIDWSPVRGTILGGPLSRLMKRDYPSYYDQFGGFSETVDSIQRYGFYPGAPISLALSMFGAKSGVPQTGEILPAWSRTALDVAQSIDPDHAGVLSRAIFPDRFRDMLIAIEVAKQGGEGVDIFTRKLLNEPVTAEETSAWNHASRNIAIFGLMEEQTSMFRFRPEELTRIHDAANAIISKMTGVPISSLDDIHKAGLKLEDVLPPLTPDIHRAINALEGWSRYTGGNIALTPSGLQQHALRIREFWSDVNDLKERNRAELLKLESDLGTGRATIDQWLQANKDIKDRQAKYLIDHHAEPRYADVPITLEERKADRLKNGLEQPMFAPIQELQQLYFAKPLLNRYNYDTGRIEPDWNEYFAYKAAIEQALPDDLLQQLKAENNQADTPLQQLYYNVSQEYLRAYNAVFDVVLRDYSPLEKRLILRFRATDNPTERATIQNTVGEDGKKLISDFNTKVKTAHENLREVDPNLDAWLVFFQKVDQPKTSEAANRLEAIKTDLGIK